MNRTRSAIRSIVCCALALSACSETGPKGYLSGIWIGAEVLTSIQFVVDRAELVSISIAPTPPSGVNWYCAGLTASDAIGASVGVPVAADSVHVVVPGTNWSATVDGKFYQVSGSLEFRGSMLLSGPACAGAVFNPVAFSARHQGE
jgi:hypothetical protein